MGDLDFEAFVHQATATEHELGSFDPYPFQRALARDGLPELLRAPTGSGKSLAAVLPWLWRRRCHPDPVVRAATPRRLVVAQPLRTLVDQLHGDVRDWLAALGLTDDVGLHVLLGGRREDEWRDHPERDAIVLGSVDMLLSRALNRGYATSRYRWPMEFGLISTDTQWVFDEVQLLGPALPTSRQLAAFRRRFGTHGPTASMWMSATVAPDWLVTVDAPDAPIPVEVADIPMGTPLHAAVHATRTIGPLVEDGTKKLSPKEIVSPVLDRHLAGTRTLVFMNTVARARELYTLLAKAAPDDVEVALVHSRFRPSDRRRATERATSSGFDPAGQIVVTTQALEAGVDITSSTLITDLCPWTALVQRAGRCNRRGETDDASLLWVQPKKSPPYEDDDLAVTRQLLETHAHQELTGRELASLHHEAPPTQPVLRRRDLEALFDTLPDLSGDDVDVSPYIRDGDERDLFVAWRHVEGDPAASLRLADAELCRVPLGGFRDWRKKDRGKDATRWWVFDHIEERWRRAQQSLLRPGVRVLVDASLGGYDPVTGWDPKSGAAVPGVDPPTTTADADTATHVAADDEGYTDDPLSHLNGPVLLEVHLQDTAREARNLTEDVGLPNDDAAAVHAAALLHDIGKAHRVFQDLLHADTDVPADVLLAKSRTGRGGRNPRQGFRHEAASLAALRTTEGAALLQQAGVQDTTLVTYLVGAHHGKVRVGARALPARSGGRADWSDPDGATSLLGIAQNDRLPTVEITDELRLAATSLDVDSLAAFAGTDAWIDEVLQLLERKNLGPFRLAYLEAMVVLSDWRASAEPSQIVRNE